MKRNYNDVRTLMHAFNLLHAYVGLMIRVCIIICYIHIITDFVLCVFYDKHSMYTCSGDIMHAN